MATAVVGHGSRLVFRLLDAVEDVFAVEHAGAALDDQVVWGQVFGVVGAAYDSHFQGFAVFFLQHPRDLFSPMSSFSGAWVQHSAIRTRESADRFINFLAPSL